MADTGDNFGFEASAPPQSTSGPEGWLGAPDPVQAFGNTIDQALQRLTVELAGLRAERDGLRLELEGVRTQLQLVHQQLTDRQRFEATVRELSQIAQQLSTPPGWSGVAAAPAPAPVYTPPPVVYTPPPPPPPPAPEPVVFAAPAPPVAPVEPEVAPFVPPAPEPEPIVYVPPAPTPEPEPEPVAFVPPTPEPAPEPEPTLYVPPAPEPEPTPEPTPEPAAEHVTSSYSFASTEVPESRVPLLSTAEDSFFSGPGIWIGEPPEAEERRGALKTWATRIGSVLAGFVVLIVFLVSIGPKFLPYQTFFVRSGSMSPTFDTGDMVILTKVDASSLKPRDIITFDRPDKPGTLVTHRIVSIETTASGKQFVTKGDANGSPDPWRVPATGTGWKYKMRLQKIGFVFGYLGTPQARLALLAIPACLLGILSLIDIWKPQQAKARGRR